MNRGEKIALIESYKALFSGMEAVVIADTSGVSVNAINEVRTKFRAEGVSFRVIKNTLAKQALVGTDLEPVCAKFQGPVAVALKKGDPVSPAKIAVAFAKDNPKFEIKGGFVSGSLLDTAGVESLAKMKGRDELRAELLSIFKAPQTQFAGICNTMVTQILGLIKARADKLEA
ncbi:MAG: 50S ribosomal protein L10 [Proteobacteria bacterium]|nr:50S ribosomal protein L10 [Pseudomonadota bacterium]